MAASPYTWSPTPFEPTLWTRKLHGVELYHSYFAHAFNGSLTMITAATIRIARGTFTESDVHKAWLLCRFQHPVIGTFVRPVSEPVSPDDTHELAYRVHSLAEAKKWVSSAVMHVADASCPTAASLELQMHAHHDVQPFAGDIHPSVRLYWRTTKDGKYALFTVRSLHCATDGRGQTVFFSRFLKNLAGPGASINLEELSWGDETCRLPGAFDVVHGFWKESVASSPELERWLQKANQRTGLGQIPFNYPVRSDASPTPWLNHSTQVTFSPSLLKRFRAACSRRGATITEAVSLLCLLAELVTFQRYYRIFDKPQPTVCETYHAMDSRAFAPGSQDYMGCAASHRPAVLKTDTLRHIVEDATQSTGDLPRIDESLWRELVSALQSQLKEIRRDADYCKFAHETTIDMLAAARLDPNVLPARGPTRGLTFSSLGDMEKLKFLKREYTSDRLLLEYMRFAGTVRTTLPVIACLFWVFRGELSIQLTACDRFYPSQFVLDCARETERWINMMIEGAEQDAPSMPVARL